MAISDIETGFGKIADSLRRNKAKREMETVRDSFIAKLAQAGANEDTLDLVGKIKAESPEKLVSAIKDIQTILSSTPLGIEQKIRQETESTRNVLGIGQQDSSVQPSSQGALPEQPKKSGGNTIEEIQK